MKPLIYLASPHSSPNPLRREWNYLMVMYAWQKLFGKGHLVFSPIMHTHPAAVMYTSNEQGFKYYEDFDKSMIMSMDEIWVVCLPGWLASVGVNEEIRFGIEIGKPIKYFKLVFVDMLPIDVVEISRDEAIKI